MDLLFSSFIALIVALCFYVSLYLIFIFLKRFSKKYKDIFDDFFKRLIPGIFGGIIMYALLQVNTTLSSDKSYWDMAFDVLQVVIMILFIMVIGLLLFRGFNSKK